MKLEELNSLLATPAPATNQQPTDLNQLLVSNTSVGPIKGSEQFIKRTYNDPNLLNVVRPIEFNDIYAYLGPNSGFAAKYPTYLPGRDNEAYAGDRQSGLEVLGNAVGQFGVLAGSTFANHWGSTVSNIGKVLTGDLKNFFDTDMSRWVADNATTAQYNFPIYTTTEMRNYEQNNVGLGASLGKYIPFIGSGAGRNWARLGGQLGFTAGTIAASVVEELALAAATAEAGGVGALAGLPRQGYKIMRSFSQVYNNLDKLEDAYKASSTLSKLGSQGLYTLRMANLATGEARMEAVMASEAFKVQQLQSFTEKGLVPTAEELSLIQDQSEKVGNTVFNWNLPILMASNVVMLKNIGLPKYLSSGKQASTAAKIVTEGGKWIPDSEVKRTVMGKLGYNGLNLLKKVGSNTISEGTEELAQGLGSRAAEQYYNIYNTDVGKSNSNFIAEVGSELSRSFTTGEGWDEFVSGALTGLLTGGIGNTVSYISSDKSETTNLANEMNNLAGNLVQSYDYKNLGEQVLIAGKSAVELENGNIKGVKDLQNEATTKFFQVARRTGKDKEAIGELMGYLKNVDPTQQDAVNEMLGDQSIEQFQAKLENDYDKFTKYADIAETMFRAKEGQDQGVMDFVKGQFVSTLMGSSNARERIVSLQRDLSNITQNSKNSSKINELTRNIFDKESLSNIIGQVSSSIDSTQEFLDNVTMTKEERYAKELQLRNDKKHLENLQAVDNALFGKETYSPEQASKKILSAITNYDPNINREELGKIVEDMVALESDNQELLFLGNMMLNPTFRDKYYNAAKEMADKANSRVLGKEQEITPPQNTNAPTAEDITQAERTLEESGLDNTTIDNLTERIRQIQQTETGFTDGENMFLTKEEAVDSILDTLQGTNRRLAVAAKEALIAKASQPVTEAEDTRLTEDEYQNIVSNPTEPISEEIENKLDKNSTDLSTEEQEVLDILKQQKQNNADTNATKGLKLPKTKADVRKQQTGIALGPNDGIITNYYNIAVGRVYRTLSGALKELGADIPKLKEVLKGTPGLTLSTVNLNDNLIKDDVTLEANVTKEGINLDLDTKGSSIVKDRRGRLIIITRSTPDEARLLIAKPVSEGGFNLYLNKSATDRFTEVRLGGPKGQTLASSFGTDVFTNASSNAIDKLRKGDRVQVVIPANEFNQKALSTFNQTDSADKAELEKAFDKLKENLVIELRKGGVVVGIMRAGDYFGKNNVKLTNKIGLLRSNVIKPEILSSIGNTDFIAGTVKVSKLVSSFQINVGEEGTIFTTLADYENSQKANKAIQVKYFLAENTETAVDKNGKVISRTGIGRTNFFIPNAIYVQVRNTQTGEEAILQAVAEEPLTFSAEDLQNNDFKNTLSINLQPSSNPLISKRVAIDENSFTNDITETTVKPEIKSEIQKTLNEGNITVDLGGFVLPLTNTEVNYDTQELNGLDPNGNERVVSFIDITNVMDSIVVPETEEVVSEIEQPTIPEIPNDQKEEWLLENAILGQQYTLEDGTPITIVRRNTDGTLIEKDGFPIFIKPDLTQESLDITKYETEAKNISDLELFNIWKSQQEGLSLRDEIMLDYNTERTAKFEKDLTQVQNDYEQGFDRYISIGVSDMLSTLNIRPNEFMLQLAQANFNLKSRGIEVNTLQQLMEEAQIEETVVESIQDVLSYGSYIALYNLVTNGVTVKSSGRRVQEGQQLMLDFGDNVVENAINVETSQQNDEASSEFMKAANKLTTSFKNLLGKQGLIIKGIDNVKNLATDEIRNMATAIKNFVLTSSFDKNDEFIKSFVLLNQALRPYNLEVNLDRLFKVESKEIGKDIEFIQINDSKNFLKEFNDVQTMQENQKRREDGKETIFIKTDKGGMVEIPVREIPSPNEAQQSDSIFLNDILGPQGYSIDDIYVVANHVVNGNASSLIERSIRRVDSETEVLYNTSLTNSPNGTSQETFFNKKKAEEKVKSKTC